MIRLTLLTIAFATCLTCNAAHLIYGFDTNTLDGFWVPAGDGHGSVISQCFDNPQQGVSCMRCSFTSHWSVICRKNDLQDDFLIHNYNMMILSWRNTNVGWITPDLELTIEGTDVDLGEIADSGLRDGDWHEQTFTWTNVIEEGVPVDLRVTLLNDNEPGYIDFDNIRFDNTSNYIDVLAWSLDTSESSNWIQGWLGNNAHLSVNSTIHTQGTGCAECRITSCSSTSWGGKWFNFMNNDSAGSVSNVDWTLARKLKWWYRIPVDFISFEFKWRGTYLTNTAPEISFDATIDDEWHEGEIEFPGIYDSDLLERLHLNAWLDNNAWPACSNMVFYLDAITVVEEIPEAAALLALPAMCVLFLRRRG